MGGVSGLHPEMRRRVLGFLAALRNRDPGSLYLITSGRRSRRKQEQLYAKAQREGTVAARPGSSLHERGLAVDLVRQSRRTGYRTSVEVDQVGAAFGLRRLPGALRARDPWHWYPVEFGERG